MKQGILKKEERNENGFFEEKDPFFFLKEVDFYGKRRVKDNVEKVQV